MTATHATVQRANMPRHTEALDLLAADIKTLHARAQQSAAEMIEHIIMCGDLLRQARELVPAGELDRWAKDATGLHPKTVREYLRFAAYADILRAELPDSRAAAKRLLSSLDLPRMNSSDQQAKEARRMAKAGATQAEIAEHFQVSRPRISQWLNPERHRQLDAKRQAARAKAVKQEQRRQQAAYMKASSKDLAAAYSLLRQSADKLQRVRGDRQVMSHVNKALHAMYHAEDQLVAASKAEREVQP